MTEVTYYFTSYIGAWDNHPNFMVDNVLTNFASTSGDGDFQKCGDNTCPGTNLGTITKVESRVYAYGDVNDRIDLLPYTPVAMEVHQTTPGVTAGWGVYVDITTDTNAPSPWTWANIANLNMGVYKENVSKGNQMNCAKVEIRVTYTPTAGGVSRSRGYIF